MASLGRIAASGGTAVAMAGSLLLAAPHASAQDPDVLTLSLVGISKVNAFIPNEVQFEKGVIWCDDAAKRSSKTPAPKGECNYPTSDGPLQLPAQHYLTATVSTASQGPASFSVTGNCSVGTSAYDPSVGPSATTQVASGSDLYVASLQQGQQCVVTASTPGNASVAPATYTYTITTGTNVDGITLNVAALGDETYNTGTTYWCSDGDPTSCAIASPDNPLNLKYQESIEATVFTASNNPATFSVTGDCAVGSSAFDPSSTPATTTQITAGQDLYVTALQGSGECVMTGTVPGTASQDPTSSSTLAPASYSYTINLVRADQQPSATLPSRKRMRVGQRLRLQGPDGIQTNAGQDISWRVLRRSRDNCRIIERRNGAVVLRATSRGKCRVVARAPGIANEWNRFAQRINIRVR